MGITEIITVITSFSVTDVSGVSAAAGAVGAVITVILKLGNIFIPFDSFRQRKVKRLLKLIDEKNVSFAGLKDLAEEQLQIEYFSYTFSLQGSNITNIAFVKQALDLIKNSNGNITINDIRLAKNTIISNGKLAIKPKLYYSNWFIFYWVLISIITLFILYVTKAIALPVGWLYYAVIVSMIISPPLLFISYIRNKSTKKIKKALA